MVFFFFSIFLLMLNENANTRLILIRHYRKFGVGRMKTLILKKITSSRNFFNIVKCNNRNNIV